jgi:hypothetical protein
MTDFECFQLNQFARGHALPPQVNRLILLHIKMIHVLCKLEPFVEITPELADVNARPGSNVYNILKKEEFLMRISCHFDKYKNQATDAIQSYLYAWISITLYDQQTIMYNVTLDLFPILCPETRRREVHLPRLSLSVYRKYLKSPNAVDFEYKFLYTVTVFDVKTNALFAYVSAIRRLGDDIVERIIKMNLK